MTLLFEARLREGIHDGSITMTFRRWRRSQVVAGGRYRTGLDMIEVERVDTVTPAAITVRDARKAGYTTVAALLADLTGTEGQPIFRIRFRRLAGPDPRDALAATRTLSESDRAEISTRLARLDRASRRGEWTETTLSLIGRSPGVVASSLAESLGLPTDVFKRDVRKLKALGLTTSLATGYRLSPRGTAYLVSRQPLRHGLGGN
ncbi:MAG: hypothetical protein LBI49_03320 [Nocardiopsaceae bacterium]|jgi:hypothetical protein|nr:hypothetical protein [Nocardiopsaceae bacterium]